jgi:hypothetical protein
MGRGIYRGILTLGVVSLVSCSDPTGELEAEYSFLTKSDAPKEELCELSTRLSEQYRSERDTTKHRYWNERQEADCAAGTGVVRGDLSYPSDVIPDDLKVCWRNLSTEESRCEEPSGERSYELTLSEGEYHIWARPDSNRSFRGFYSAASKCGLSVDCLSHRPLAVPVLADQITSGIDTSDWYGPQGANYD